MRELIHSETEILYTVSTSCRDGAESSMMELVASLIIVELTSRRWSDLRDGGRDSKNNLFLG